MKPLTNETLIEELIQKHISLESYEAVDGRMITMKEAKDDIMVVNVHGLKKDLLSAIQAKERVMVEKMLKEMAEMPVVLVDVRFNSTDKPKYAHALLYEELKSKLSNLSK